MSFEANNLGNFRVTDFSFMTDPKSKIGSLQTEWESTISFIPTVLGGTIRSFGIIWQIDTIFSKNAWKNSDQS